jgi:hypothetical protein
MKNNNESLFKSCRHSEVKADTKNIYDYSEVRFIPNWCSLFEKRCKTTLVHCHKYEQGKVQTGRLSGEKL